MNPLAALSLRPGNRKNAISLIVMILGVGLVITFAATGWDRELLYVGLGLLGLTSVTHTAGNVAAKRTRPAELVSETGEAWTDADVDHILTLLARDDERARGVAPDEEAVDRDAAPTPGDPSLISASAPPA